MALDTVLIKSAGTEYPSIKELSQPAKQGNQQKSVAGNTFYHHKYSMQKRLNGLDGRCEADE